jgi:hypothetical protein
MEGNRKSQSRPDSTRQTIPARVVIGVTGHRKLENQLALTRGIHLAIEKIRQIVPSLRSTPLVLCVLSPLAEGADRLVTREVLKVPGSMLEVILPLGKDEYKKSFETDESRDDFEKLLSQAVSVRMLPSKSDLGEAYEQVGHYIVDQCDVLIALWDGKPAADRGGTAEIVQHARETGCPLFWIHTEDSDLVTVEVGRGLNTGLFEDLDEYNSEKVNASKFEKQLKAHYNFFMGEIKRAKLPAASLRPTLEYILRHYVRTDLVALYYQHLYHRMESVIYALALAAVAIAAFQVLFIPEQSMLLIVEVALMLAALVIVGIIRRKRWHSKWIDYRFLAERFRSALFMAVPNIDVATLRPPRHLSLSYSSKDWMVSTFSAAWIQRPRAADAGSYEVEGLRCFLCEAWLEDQIRYHDKTRMRHYQRHVRMGRASYIMFGLTVCAVLLHIANFGPHLLEFVFAFMAIIFPAIGASIAAIRTHRDYLRNSMRSAEMVRHLKELKIKMMLVKDFGGLLKLLKETEETMLHENEDWRVVVRFNITEVPT